MATSEEIKSAVNIVDIVGKTVSLKKKGPDYVGLCPFHNEKTPSFTVSPVKGIYKCFGCGKSGDSFSFIMDTEHIGFIEAVKKAAITVNMELDKSLKEYVKPIPRLEKLSPKYIDWFQGRGISNNTLLRFGITEAIEWMPQHAKETPVLCFNYYRGGELVNIKFRGPQKAFKLAKDAELIFYNLDALENQSEIYIVEGEIDALSLYEAGIFNVVSVPNGASTGNQSLPYLDACFNYFTNLTKIILFTDKDQPGYNLREELCRRLGRERCYKVDMPEDCKDANDILVKHGSGKLKEVCEKASQWPVDGVFTMDELFDDVVNFYENGYPKGDDCKIKGFDELLTFLPGQITTVTGIPGSGKSEFLDYIITSLTKFHQWSFGVCSFENQPSAFHVTKLLEKFTGKCFQFRADRSQRMSIPQFEEAVGIVDQYYHFIKINEIDLTITGILDKAKELVSRKGIKGLLIDPWNYIEHKIPSGHSETQYISESLTAIKSFAIQYGVHVFLVAHPTKIARDKKTGEYEIPNLYNISGSAHFFNKTDNGITVYRNFNTGIVDVYIQKVRNSWAGKCGFCSFTYDTFIRQYNPI